MKPTTMVAPGFTGASRLQSGETNVVEMDSTTTTPFVMSKIILREDQLPDAEKALSGLDFVTIKPASIVQLGHEAELGLNTTLDGFLTRLDRSNAAPIFELFTRLKKGVKDSDLEGVLKQIETAHPGFFAKIMGAVRHKSATDIAHDTIEGLRQTLAGKTGTLRDLVAQLEIEMKNQIAKLVDELRGMEKLKDDYSVHLGQFALAAAVTEAFVKKATEHVERRRGELTQNTSNEARQEIVELETKLQLLQSRALALEGTYTRLPADQEVIRQIQIAGVTTLGETLTTQAARMASIKMTLITANSALAVKGVQNLAKQGQELDESLASARGKLVQQVATAAAAAPGDNRLAQVVQIQKIIAESAELYRAVEVITKQNSQKFASAKLSFEKARETMADLRSQQSVAPATL